MASWANEGVKAHTQNTLDRNKRALIEDRDLLDQQLGDSGRKRKKRKSLPTILGAGLQTDTTLQTLLGS